jgi:hypothetical protein
MAISLRALLRAGLGLALTAMVAAGTGARADDTIYTDPGDKQAGKPDASSQPVDAETCDHAFQPFDKGNPDGKWLGNTTDKDKVAWLQYTFKAEGYAVGRYRIISANDAPERDPKDWQVLGSNDGKDWTVLDERKGQSWTDRFVTNKYKIKEPKVFKIYRLAISANNGSTEDNQGGTGLVQLARWQLLPPAPPTTDVILTDPDNNTQGGDATASSEPVDAERSPNAFADGTDGKWLGNITDEDKGAWLQFAFKGVGYAASKYKIVSANDAPERDPKHFEVLGSNDGKTWDKLDEQKDQSWDDRFQASKAYPIANPKVYKIYRLHIIENNGSTEDNQGGKGLTQLARWILIK